MRLDMKSFKKVREDARSAVLQHPDGHQIHIAKESLTPKLKEQLSTLPIHKWSGGDTGAGGGDIPFGDLIAQEKMNNAPYSMNEMQAADQGSPITIPSSSQMMASSGMPIPGNHERAPVPIQTSPQAPAEPPKPLAAPENYKIPQQQAPSGGIQYPGAEGYIAATGEQIKGTEQAAKALGEQGRLQAQASQQAAASLENTQKDFQARQQHLTQQIDSVVKDVSEGHINPNHYMENMSIPGKVSTALGMILGGLGSGLTGGPNPAMQFLQSQIDRDIASQQANVNNKQTLFHANMQMLGNARDATEMTKAMQLGILSAKLGQAAGATQDPLQRANALKAKGELDAQIEPLKNQINLRQQVLGQARQGAQGAQTASNDIPLAMRVHYLPGVSETDKKEAMREIKEQENINSANKMAMDAFDKVAGLQNFRSRFLNPVQSSRQIEATWKPMLDKLTKDNTGRVTPITAELFSSLEPLLRDSKTTVSDVRGQLYKLLNENRSTPYLTGMGLAIPKDVGLAKANTNVTQGYNQYASRNK